MKTHLGRWAVAVAAVMAWMAIPLAASAAARPATQPVKRPAKGNSATQPSEKGRPTHDQFVARAKKGNIDLLFYGDSITAGWGNNEVWQKYYGKLNAANFGIGGDRTQHVLWRILNGEVEGIAPKVVVLMIGTNNLGANTGPEITDGITLIVKTLREKLPASKVLLLGIFPRGQSPGAQRDNIKEINAAVAKLDDGNTVRYLDIGEKFLEKDGTITKGIMPDFLHLTKKGYEIWAEAMQPLLAEMMGIKPAAAP